MEKQLFVGLDVHRKSVVATAMDKEGKKVRQTKLGGSSSELAEFIRTLPGDKVVAMEACPMWEHFYEAVASTGVTTYLSHPYRTRLIAEASLKSDHVDSEAIATLLRTNALPLAYAPPQSLRDLRRLIRDWAFYKRLDKAVKSHIYCVLMAKGIPYENGLLQAKKRREELRVHGIPEVDRGLDFLEHIEGVENSLRGVVHKAYLCSPEAQLLSSIPGIGEFFAVAMVAWLTPVDRFQNVRQVVSYCGLCPTNHQSGETAYHGRMKNDCNRLLRWLFVEAGWKYRAHEKSGWPSKAGKRAARRHHRGGGAMVTAQKLVQLVYAVLRRGTPYQHEAPGRLSHCAPMARLTPSLTS